MTTNHWLTVQQVADDLDFKPKTIREWCNQGRFEGARKFPDDKPRSEWRIPEEAVKAVLASRVSSHSPPLTSKRRAELMEKLVNQ